MHELEHGNPFRTLRDVWLKLNKGEGVIVLIRGVVACVVLEGCMVYGTPQKINGSGKSESLECLFEGAKALNFIPILLHRRI